MLAERIKNLPPYLFARLEKLKEGVLAKGVDLIDLSIGDPDIPTSGHIVEALQEAVKDPRNHSYPSSVGMLSFREAVAEWFEGRFGLVLDPVGEILSMMGSKDGVGHMPLAFVDPGDIVLIPTPGYPVYAIGTLFAGGQSHYMPLLEENGYLPDLGAIPDEVLDKAKIMWLNYPNNPTAALGTREFFAEAIGVARKHNIIICHDAAYSELYMGEEKPFSFLEVDGAREVGVELHSLSKTFNMTGWRIGFAVGNRDVIAGLANVKGNLDSGVFKAVQVASIAALKTDDRELAKLRNTYRERRDVLYEGLIAAGFSVNKPEATFYLWSHVPEGYTSASFTEHLLEKCGIMATPGSGFGDPGEGYVRFALTVGVERMKEAAARIRSSL